MATAKRLTGLFHALASQDHAVAMSIAEQICEDEERKGNRTAARLLKGALSPNAKANGQVPGPPIAPARSLLVSGALTTVGTSAKLGDIELKARTRKELQHVVHEWHHRLTLKEKGLRPRNRLFFHGPPGCGKSLTAAALGNELSLPTYIVRFDGVVGAYLGQTAIHLRQLFQFAEATPCVLIFDELDALGKKRGNPLDVGELDRIVIAMMQELEHASPLGLIVATSNLPTHLDEALWRRFDSVLEFPKPTKAELVKFAKQLVSSHHIKLLASLRTSVESATSFAQVEKLVENEVRRNLLKGV